MWRRSVYIAMATDLNDTLRAELVPQEHRERLQAYSECIAKLTRTLGPIPAVSLVAIPGPVLQFAHQHSEEDDPIAENHAAIISSRHTRPKLVLVTLLEMWHKH